MCEQMKVAKNFNELNTFFFLLLGDEFFIGFRADKFRFLKHDLLNITKSCLSTFLKMYLSNKKSWTPFFYLIF